MNDWILFTPSVFSESLTTEQSETIAARPHQGTALDPLELAIAEALTQVLDAVRANGMNRLSADPRKVPHQLRACASALTQVQLELIWPTFAATQQQKDRMAAIEGTLTEVREGRLPVTLPSDPLPENTVRRTAPVSVLRERKSPLSAQSLQGL